ncbi:hypothetical protein [Terricaulis sp.]|jgi:hypothetical protein|uniref:hypothetical protein n=1 Tax=Terricaulis sp. TaxID=2768686 RepID=UPI002AC37EFD|nr:hypothetical protein [Terricaulis sp.]MDZ4691002.1 hypothetical protein [Terricaulis sp.]
MSSSTTKATVRMIAASFAAGVSAMMLVGLVAPVAMQGGLEMRDAAASTREARPSIGLDVAAVEAQLADADRAMVAMRATTADEMQRLQALSGR